MKKLIFFGIVFIAACACSSQRESTGSGKPAGTVAIDSTEYEITIIDPDFDRWYLTHYSPALERSNEYYHSMNIQGVSNWNLYFTRNRYSSVIGSYINYNPSEDYGIDVNRRLYWYFRFIEKNYRIRLMH
ncbi:MAG: hypothetical protein IPN08_18705 [Bacteroidales bacterium]|nr:hypothetical protein [Bacteroidales bacterium]MBK9359374.1 hypothetical protein [Bacteroidales bacterium]